ncbi:MAG: class I SAM-dependent methyltransferase [Terriglobales bacterium]
MSKFQITLIRPQGFIHSEGFREVAETLQFGLRSIGHAAEIGENAIDPNATNILLGAHLLPAVDANMVPANSILYNLEQLGGANLSPKYYELASRHQVWDYSLRNIEQWRTMSCLRPPVHVPLGYVPELSRIQAAPVQDIDVLFYGSLNERRSAILKALRDSGVKVHAVFGVYGKERDELIARSKIVLNVHFYDTKVFEIVRLSYLLANSKAVVSECSSENEMEQDAQGAFLAVPYGSLVESCQAVLRNEEERRKLEIRGLQWFSRQRESGILARALSQVAVPAPTCAERIAIPRTLNLGSGKDWRADCFNADIDPYWQPDAVLDFDHPLPIGQTLQTERFGAVTLENNYFDEIIVNDVLEHIPHLTTAMTSCLNLLKVGGLFRISVPYDLSWGAWQDPTHVRAFNERSWLYYTDWFWYLGWTEARFDIAGFDLGLSPVGEALKLQQVKGEDLVRHPRAVDQMRVVLRKRLLTEAEKQQVLKYLKRPDRKATAASQSSVAAPVMAKASPVPLQVQAQVTQIAGATDSPLIAYLQSAFNKAMAGAGRMDPAVLEIDGMSGRKYRLLINNLVATLPNARYLEIGTWSGSTLCSAINGNTVRAAAIDNWSEFGGPKAQFLQNLQRFKTPGAEVSFIERDFRSVDFAALGRFNVYMFDGPHTAADQFDGISLVLPALDDEFILIVDDWNHPPARQGTLKALDDLKLSVLHSFEIRTTMDGSHATLARQASDWHNGYFIAVVSKPKAQKVVSYVDELQAQAVPV